MWRRGTFFHPSLPPCTPCHPPNRLSPLPQLPLGPLPPQVILDEPVDKWPECECLLSWYSDGFPLAKAQAYAALRHPFLVNDLQMQVGR